MRDNKTHKRIKRQTPIREKVRDYIYQGIINGDLVQGTRIIETKLAKELGVSQSPVREALHDLEMRGLVEYNPYKGTFIREITVEDMRDMYYVRAGLEKVALEHIFINITSEALLDIKETFDLMMDEAINNNFEGYITYDDKFHEKIVLLSNNQVLIRLWKQCNMIDWIRKGTELLHEKDLIKLAKRHYFIIESLENRDKDASILAVEKHLEELLNTMSAIK